jgi:predicted enzyme related to lactoylglutathione lyase
MHHSRVSTLMIDCLDGEFESSLEFWSEALGLAVQRRPAQNQRYVTLGAIEGPLFVRLQRVTDRPGYHLDIESDDLAAEVSRLEQIGAQHKRRIKRWWVAQDPSGNAFCVIRPESDQFPRNANRWKPPAADG